MEEEEEGYAEGGGFFDINDPDTFLGGQNVHNLVIIGLLMYIVIRRRE